MTLWTIIMMALFILADIVVLEADPFAGRVLVSTQLVITAAAFICVSIA